MVKKFKKIVLGTFSALILIWLLLLFLTAIKEADAPVTIEELRDIVYLPIILEGLDEAQSRNKLSISAIDEAGKMLFVTSSAEIVEQLADENEIVDNRDFVGFYKDFVRRFRPQWNEEWNFTIFTEHYYVGYRNKPEIKAIGEEWFANYLVHYSSRINRLIVYPALPEKRAVLRCG
jgi:hypothetical protein